MIWDVPDLLPSTAPQLSEGEKILISVGDVGLYKGDTKSAEHVKGTVYLTTQRLAYVDSHDPVMHSVQVLLAQIIDASYSPGFLKTSAKVALEMRAVDEQRYKQTKNTTWVCSICSFSNPSTSNRCETCGVEAQDEGETEGDTSLSAKLEPGECPMCTFQNHPSLRSCEMCGASLQPQDSRASSSLGSSVKLSFRKGQSHAFYDKLRTQLDTVTSTAATTTPSLELEAPVSVSNSKNASQSEFGIQKLRSHTRTLQEQSLGILARAMQGTEQFRAVAPDIVAIAERLGSSSTIPIVVSVDADRPEDLARQIADLLIGEDLLARAGGMITLHDLYSLLNRSRGIGLINPQQLSAAIDRCEPLKLPLRVRVLDSGLKIVESRGALDQAVQRLVAWIVTESQEVSWRAGAGFSARDVSDQMQCSVQIAAEELALAEQRGKLCRDEHTSGLRFFPNLIRSST